MLKKYLRVSNHRDFERVYKKGQFEAGKFLKINILENRRDFTRGAVVVSKKIEKRAVRRNKAKRKVWEALRLIYPDIKKGFDIIINLKKEAIGEKFETLKRDLLTTLEKINLIKK